MEDHEEGFTNSELERLINKIRKVTDWLEQGGVKVRDISQDQSWKEEERGKQKCEFEN